MLSASLPLLLASGLEMSSHAHPRRTLPKWDIFSRRKIIRVQRFCFDVSRLVQICHQFSASMWAGCTVKRMIFLKPSRSSSLCSPTCPTAVAHAYAIALVHFDQEQYQAAIDTLTTLRSKGISDAKCADLLSVAYSKLGRDPEAYAVMVENLRQDPSNPYAYYNLITLFVDTGELDKAAQVADKAVAALPPKRGSALDARLDRAIPRQNRGRLS